MFAKIKHLPSLAELEAITARLVSYATANGPKVVADFKAARDNQAVVAIAGDLVEIAGQFAPPESPATPH